MTGPMPEWIGWVATAAFVLSYYFRDPATLRRVQGLAALLWMAYGIAIGAMPVIVANVIVATVALVSSLNRPRRRRGDTGPPRERA